MEGNVDQKVSQSKIVASDLPRGVALLADLTANLNNVLGAASVFADKIKNGEMNTSKGISLLDLKNQVFLSYLTNLTYMILRKLRGVKLEDDPVIDRLVELRVIIERLRPLEDKMKYQLDKYVKVANEGVLNADDPLRLRGNLDNIGSSDEDKGEEEEGEKKKKKKKKVEKSKKKDEVHLAYKVPKIAPVHYDEDKKKEAIEKARRRALNSAVVRDALHEYANEPEVVYNADTLKQKSIKKRKELEAYEEDNFLRKSLSKREQAEMNHITTLGTMESEILGFSNLDALQDGYNPSGPPTKRQKTGKANKGKNKGKGKVKGKKAFKKRNR